MISRGIKEKFGVLFIMVVLLTGTKVICQTRKELEKKRAEALRDIELTNILLDKTKSSRAKSLNELIILRRKIERRNSVIGNLKHEIDLINEELKENSLIIDALEKDLIKIKKEYERIIRGSYKKSKNLDNLIYILASENFGQAYRRIKYYQQYADYREKQAKKIVAIKNILRVKEEEMEKERNKKQDLVNIKRRETEQMNREENIKNNMVVDLQSKEKKLRNEIKKATRISRELEAEIRKMIAEERERKRGNMRLTPEEEIIDVNFVNNKGKLPWPTEKGVIVEKFGEHQHAVLKNVKINNNGIDIATIEKAEVRAIFEGEVRKIIAIKGANNTVLIKHGNYFSVYQNLIDVNVKAGDKVKTKEKIGSVYTDNNSEKNNIVHLEIWENNKKMNPEEWIAN